MKMNNLKFSLTLQQLHLND